MASRGKTGTKAGWKKRDAAFRQTMSENKRNKRQRKGAARLFEVMAGWRPAAS